MTSTTKTLTTNPVRDNIALNRFELDVEGGVAFATYRRTAAADIITHTETPGALRGRDAYQASRSATSGCFCR